jgi:hypothetical protein
MLGSSNGRISGSFTSGIWNGAGCGMALLICWPIGCMICSPCSRRLPSALLTVFVQPHSSVCFAKEAGSHGSGATS